MKKYILKLVFASAFALLAGYSVYASQQETELSEFALANIEAIAKGEVIVGVPCAQICQNCWCIYFDPYEEIEGTPYV